MHLPFNRQNNREHLKTNKQTIAISINKNII